MTDPRDWEAAAHKKNHGRCYSCAVQLELVCPIENATALSAARDQGIEGGKVERDALREAAMLADLLFDYFIECEGTNSFDEPLCPKHPGRTLSDDHVCSFKDAKAALAAALAQPQEPSDD